MKTDNTKEEEIFLGTFYGKDLILKDPDDELPKEEWVKRWENYIIMLKKEAVDKYKTDKILEEMEKYKPSKMKILKKIFTRFIN